MNILTATLVILSVFSANNPLASSGNGRDHRSSSVNRSRKSYQDSRDWTQSDMELWESFGRWRRERENRGRRDSGDRDHRRERDRWIGDDRNDHKDRNDRGHGRGREDRRSGRNRPDYPQPEIPTEQPPISKIPFPPLPIIIEPIRPPPVMPSIIEPYPVVETTVSYASSSDYYTESVSYAAPSSHKMSVTGSYGTVSSIVPTASYAPPSKTVVAPIPRHNLTSVPVQYDSTVIMTTPESTVTTSVTGRYRAMSNSAAGVKTNSWAGPISFALVIVSSILLIAIV